MTIRFPNLDLEWDFIPRAFYFLGYEFTFLGLLIAAGMLLGLFVIVMDARRKHKNTNHYLGMTILVILGSLIGGRLLYAVCNWDIFRENPMDLFQLRNGGMSLFGAMAGGTIFGALYCLIARQPFWDMADTLALGALLVQIVGRFGDFFNRESFGEYVDYILSMQIPVASVRAGDITDLMRENLQEIHGTLFVQVNPLFLYESVGCFLLFIVFLAMNRRKRFAGAIFMRYLACYGLLRFCIEWFRTDKMMIPGTEIDLNLVIAAAIFVIFGIMAWVRSVMTKKRENLRKEQRERHYQREEAVAAEMDAKDEIRERIARERLEEADREVAKVDQSLTEEVSETEIVDGQDSLEETVTAPTVDLAKDTQSHLDRAELEEVLDIIAEIERERAEEEAADSTEAVNGEETSEFSDESLNKASSEETNVTFPEASEESPEDLEKKLDDLEEIFDMELPEGFESVDESEKSEDLTENSKEDTSEANVEENPNSEDVENASDASDVDNESDDPEDPILLELERETEDSLV